MATMASCGFKGKVVMTDFVLFLPLYSVSGFYKSCSITLILTNNSVWLKKSYTSIKHVLYGFMCLRGSVSYRTFANQVEWRVSRYEPCDYRDRLLATAMLLHMKCDTRRLRKKNPMYSL